MKRNQHKKRSEAGFSLIELLIVIVIIGILSAISTLYLISSRRSANGASAVASMRVFTSAETSYAAGIGNKNYGDAQDIFRQDYIDNALARACLPTPVMASVGGSPALPFNAKSGFVFSFVVTLGNPAANTPPDFQVSGAPLNTVGVARDGDRTYYVDSTGVVRVSPTPTALADINSVPLQ
jgi:prepilin-type N-terminal cleavage/methylation domain-containing protein